MNGEKADNNNTIRTIRNWLFVASVGAFVLAGSGAGISELTHTSETHAQYPTTPNTIPNTVPDSQARTDGYQGVNDMLLLEAEISGPLGVLSGIGAWLAHRKLQDKE